MENIKEVFEKETGLKLKETLHRYAFFECSGANHELICFKIVQFNLKYNTNIYCTYNNNKDLTTIYFLEGDMIE